MTDVQLPESITCDATLWATCIGGAMQMQKYIATIEATGLKVVKDNPQYRFISSRIPTRRSSAYQSCRGRSTSRGDKFDPAKTRALGPGSAAIMPAGAPMFGFTREETVIQLHGTGPWGITYLDPADDPRKR